MQTPKYPLSEVKRLINEWKQGKDAGFFSAPSASTEYVIHIFSCRQEEAEKIILDGILKLEESGFGRQALQLDVVVVDIYGLESYLGYDWYVKFLIEDGTLDEISFHPLERDLKLADGRNLESVIDESKKPSWRRKED